MQVDRGAGLGLDEQVIRPRLGEHLEIALRLDDHEMHIEGLGSRPSDGLQHDRPDRDVGHEAAIHHIDMNPVGAGAIDRAHLLAQAREVRRQHGRRDQNRRHRQRRAAPWIASVADMQDPSRRRLDRAPAGLRARSCASRRAIDKPEEFAQGSHPGRWRLAVAGPDVPQDGRFLATGHQKRDTLAALDRGIGHGDADFGPSVRDGDHPALALLQHGLSGQQRSGVAVGPRPSSVRSNSGRAGSSTVAP